MNNFLGLSRRVEPRFYFLCLALIFEGGILLLACLLSWYWQHPLFRYLSISAGGLCWGLISSIPLFFLFFIGMELSWKSMKEIRQFMMTQFYPLIKDCSLFELALVSLLAGCGEELFFRGFLQELISNAWGMPAGLIVSSMVFSMMHPVSLMYSIVVFFISLYLGIIFIVSNTLFSVIVCHSVYDFVAMLSFSYFWKANKKGRYSSHS